MTEEFNLYLQNYIFKKKKPLKDLAKKKWYVTIHNRKGQLIAKQPIKVSFEDNQFVAPDNVFPVKKNHVICSMKIWMGDMLCKVDRYQDNPFRKVDNLHLQWSLGFLRID